MELVTGRRVKKSCQWQVFSKRAKRRASREQLCCGPGPTGRGPWSDSRMNNKKRQDFPVIMELVTGIGPVTPTLPRWCSTAEPHQHSAVFERFLRWIRVVKKCRFCFTKVVLLPLSHTSRCRFAAFNVEIALTMQFFIKARQHQNFTI